MSYIVVLNPLIIGTVADADGNLLGGAGSVPESTAMVGSVTSLAAGLPTILMGVVGKYPFAIAVGLGLNSFLAVSVASQMSWQEAMGLVLIEGVVITLLVITKVRVAVLHAIPSDLKTAMSVGIGLFIAFIGLVDSGFIRRIPDEAGTTVPVSLGIGGTLAGWPIVVFLVGLVLTAILVMRKVGGAIFIGMATATVLAIIVEALCKPGPSLVDGKPGFANIVTGGLFLVAMFIAPLVSIVPFEAATPALVIVGLAMMAQIRRIDFSDVAIVIPCLLTAVLMPFSFSIAVGLGAGMITYVILRSFQGRAREVHPLLWGVAALFALYFAAHPIRVALGID